MGNPVAFGRCIGIGRRVNRRVNYLRLFTDARDSCKTFLVFAHEGDTASSALKDKKYKAIAPNVRWVPHEMKLPFKKASDYVAAAVALCTFPSYAVHNLKSHNIDQWIYEDKAASSEIVGLKPEV